MLLMGSMRCWHNSEALDGHRIYKGYIYSAHSYDEVHKIKEQRDSFLIYSISCWAALFQIT
jgi:hypothetical protein